MSEHRKQGPATLRDRAAGLPPHPKGDPDPDQQAGPLGNHPRLTVDEPDGRQVPPETTVEPRAVSRRADPASWVPSDRAPTQTCAAASHSHGRVQASRALPDVDQTSRRRGRTGDKHKEPMTEVQRRLVRANTGLVGVHLRRYVRNLAVPRRDREWDDLFQEGCLGLIEAARLYDPRRGIPFAAFALPRIHKAVSRALQSKFATVRIPPDRPSRSCGTPAEPRPASRVDGVRADPARAPASGLARALGSRRPKVCSLSDAGAAILPARRQLPSCDVVYETVGERIRSRYEQAVSLARDDLSKGVTTRGDRHTLVRILAEERFLMPCEESRRALRQIARDTHSSYARVAEYDKQLARAIGGALEADPEFQALQHQARTAPAGGDTPMDDRIERRLAQAARDEFLQRYARADDAKKASLLQTVLTMSQCDTEELVAARFASLPVALRERLLRESACLADRSTDGDPPPTRDAATTNR